jgi:hypothetical protein
MKKIMIFLMLAMLVIAHAPEEHDADAEIMNLAGYEITILRPTTTNVGDQLTFAIQVDKDGSYVSNLEVQGQIIDPETNKDIYYAKAEETYDGEYTFSWQPGFAGDYYVQFVIRVDDGIKPTFAITVEDPRGKMWLTGGIILAILALIIGIVSARKQKKIIPAITAIGIGLLFVWLSYSVSYFYQAGGERGFVVCGDDGCDLAIHWHAQMYFDLCGQDYTLPLESGDLNNVHTHKEANYLHYHALIKTNEAGSEILEPEKLAIGNIFDFMGVEFTNECFNGYCNGQDCNGKPGTLKVIVNGQENSEFNNYWYKDGDEIEVIFSS